MPQPDTGNDEVRLFAHLLIQVTAEQETDQALWPYLDAPAVEYHHAMALAPALAEAVQTAQADHENSDQHAHLLYEQEHLAQAKARQIPPPQRAALARAARLNMAALLASS